ncbi:uncharacterized protein LOC112082843 [Eutrema salsugineum]|uniref:uncharacterized protein LOC112082843 n=1 Tax=Eutrema salsugineum TaxID=72664 RepID=UPI000CECF997|nr:uncharacterized protein LOC112082843 [Eutrema salsugineum]
MEHILNLMEDQSLNVFLRQSIPWLQWNIWKNRNATLFSRSVEAAFVVCQRSSEEAILWHSVNNPNHGKDGNTARNSNATDRWHPPLTGLIKCNINANWRNSLLHSGGAWIARNHTGSVLFHAREAFTPSPNRLIAEFRVIIWALQSAKDLHFTDIIIASDLIGAVEAIQKPSVWPKFRVYSDHINVLKSQFNRCEFEIEAPVSNSVTRAIAKSVTKDGRYHSYLAMGGPSWLQDQLNQEARYNV